MQHPNPLFTTLFPRLNPCHLLCEIHDRPFHTGRFSLVSLPTEAPLSSWTRLETIDLKGRIPFGSREGSVVCLPREQGKRKRKTRLHVATHLSASYPDVRAFLGLLVEARWAEVMGLREGAGGEEAIELVVNGEKERDEALEAVEGLDAKWRGSFLIKLES